MKLGRRLRQPLDSFLARQSLISTGRFIDPSDVPGIAVLRENWEVIRDEAMAVLVADRRIPALGEISRDHRRIAPDKAWKSFFFNGYGYLAKANHERCPRIAALIDQVPDVVVAFFSIFEPETHVPPHRGVTKAMLNVHLALRVPPKSDRCEMRVEDEFRRWEEREFLIFDETHQHEAWNESGQPRIILFLQVIRPMIWLGRLVGKAFLRGIRYTTYVQDERKAIGA